MYVIATAGHVDHGKSTLLRALTGMEPDRWAEEQRRGMTIDLGYVWTTLADGSEIAFVDVPGHQRFVGNMLAGVGPVPAVLLVVAADEGWARQTAEHVDALDALGVRHGILAISRSDLGDAELAASEAHDHLAGTSLEGIEAVLVSGLTGAGLDDLRSALGRLVRSLPTDIGSTTRLWVDRVFSVRGSGTVVTGTLSSGRIAVGDELVLMPGATSVAVRGLQSLKHPVSSVEAVARVAVNLRGVKVDEVRRGSALVSVGRFDDVGVLDVRLTRADERLPKQVVLHIGSAAVPAQSRRLRADLARLTLDTPLPLHVGERGLLRDPGAQQIVAGFVVLDPSPPSLQRRGAAAARAETLAGLTGRPHPTEEVDRRRVVRRGQLVRYGVLEPDDAVPGSAREAGGWLIADDQWTLWQKRLAEYVRDWATQNPMSPGAPRAAISRALQIPDARLLEVLVGEMPELTSDAGGIHRTDVQRSFSPDVEQALSAISERLALDPFDAPSVPELREAGLSDRHLGAAVKDGLFIRVAESVYLRTDALDVAVARLAALPQPFTVAEARIALGTSRRVMLPVLELLDNQRRTQRIDDSRRQVRAT